MNIYVSGPLGYESAERLYKDNRALLEGRFAGFFLRQFEGIAKDLKKESDLIFKHPGFIYEITEGGIFRALWNLGEELESGLIIDLSLIPVRQEVTEILELFNESPYECSSKGSFLIASDEDCRLTEGASQIVYIGRTADTKARLIIEGENTRYLTPPSRQDKDIEDRMSYL